MKEVVIHSEADLIENLPKILDPSIFRILRRGTGRGSSRRDLVLRTSFGGHSATFVAECKLRPSATVLDQAKQRAARREHPLLVTVRLTESLVEQCRREGISCLDLNGRVWVKAPGLLIDRYIPGPDIRYRLAEPEIRFFSLKSTRLARALLSYPDRTWRQVDLVELTGLSQGLVSRLLNYAAGQGWVEGKRGDWKLVNLGALLDAWEKEDDWSKRVTLRQYSTLEADTGALARRLAKNTVGELAFTQWFAANLRYPYVQVAIVSAYRLEFLSEDEQHKLSVREVSDGGKLWVAIPRDSGVFQTIQRIQGLPLVCDAQIYLDLVRAGFRGPEQAKALREWKGFCIA